MHSLPGQPPEALTAENGCFHRSEVASGPPHSPVLIKISADKRPLNQLTVKNLFFSLIIKTFCHQHHRIVHEKAINLSVWMKEICALLVKLHIIFSRMQRVNQHARPSIIQVECCTCCYQVCPLDHAKGGTADLDYHSEPYHRNDFEPAAGNFVVPIDMYQLKKGCAPDLDYQSEPCHRNVYFHWLFWSAQNPQQVKPKEILSKNYWPCLVKFENREIWADLRHQVIGTMWLSTCTHHVTSHVTCWSQWKYTSCSWPAVSNHHRRLEVM